MTLKLDTSCAGCGMAIPPHPGAGRPRKWCSRQCAERSRRAMPGGTTKPYGEKRGTCAACGEVMWRDPRTSLPDGVARCLPCRRANPARRPVPKTAGSCAMCGAGFVGNRGKRFCSRTCIDRAKPERGGGARDRARRLGVTSERYTRPEIAERDGYRCGLCGEGVDMAVAYPDNESPSIDHVVPLALGGDDTPENVQLAHLGCNIAKGARVEAAV